MRKARHFNVIIEGFRGVQVWLASSIGTVVGNDINDS